MNSKPRITAITKNSKSSPEDELIKVNNEIKSYLEKVEFYFEEPDSNKLNTLQKKRTELELAINKKSKVPNYSTAVTSTPNVIKQLTKKINYLESQIEGLKCKLEKEKEFRVKLHTRVQVYRQEVLRYLYESHNDISSINWIGEMIKKKPTWGKTKDTNQE